MEVVLVSPSPRLMTTELPAPLLDLDIWIRGAVTVNALRPPVPAPAPVPEYFGCSFLESLAVTGNTYGAVKTTYERSQLPIEHLINLVPSSVAWRLLKPFLRDSDAIKLSRIS